jgi:hypothetical protein
MSLTVSDRRREKPSFNPRVLQWTIPVFGLATDAPAYLRGARPIHERADEQMPGPFMEKAKGSTQVGSKKQDCLMAATAGVGDKSTSPPQNQQHFNKRWALQVSTPEWM